MIVFFSSTVLTPRIGSGCIDSAGGNTATPSAPRRQIFIVFCSARNPDVTYLKAMHSGKPLGWSLPQGVASVGNVGGDEEGRCVCVVCVCVCVCVCVYVCVCV